MTEKEEEFKLPQANKDGSIDIKIPLNGFAIVFENSPDLNAFRVLGYNNLSDDLPDEEIHFCFCMSKGLSYLATNKTKEVIEAGLEHLHAQKEQEQKLELLENKNDPVQLDLEDLLPEGEA